MVSKSLPPAPSDDADFHAHVYYDAGEKAAAEMLRARLEDWPGLVLGRWHDAPVGPHPTGSFQIAFRSEDFGRLVPWLMKNRNGLIILVHALTGNDLRDHTEFAAWLGGPLPLDLKVFD